MRFKRAYVGHAFLPSLSAPAGAALTLGSSACETRPESMSCAARDVRRFRSIVLGYWRKHGRHDLPWRKTKDPYKILVSEIMLQQTQVSRVIPKYNEFLKQFPNVKVLAKAQLIDVLRVWSGLGYNRRAKFLHDAAIWITKEYKGKFPQTYEGLRRLPGVGEYTAKAILVFAFNQPEVLIETNIRTVYLRAFFQDTVNVSDREVHPYMEKAAKGQNPRTWHWSLMDNGAYLKKSGVKLNAKSAHYSQQSKFEGSLRQVRGAILRAQVHGEKIRDFRDCYGDKFAKALASLRREGLLTRSQSQE